MTMNLNWEIDRMNRTTSKMMVGGIFALIFIACGSGVLNKYGKNVDIMLLAVMTSWVLGAVMYYICRRFNVPCTGRMDDTSAQYDVFGFTLWCFGITALLFAFIATLRLIALCLN